MDPFLNPFRYKLRLIAWQFILVIIYAGSSVSANEPITNPYRNDGFGGQFQTIIYSFIYAELNNKTFFYTPFSAVEHNYDNESDYISKKEWLVNLINYYPVNTDVKLQKKIAATHFIEFFEKNLQSCVNSISLKKIRKIFRLNKVRSHYFDDEHLHVAVHIRRPNSHDNRINGTDTPDSVYANIINVLRNKYFSSNPLFHIYSQGNEENFRKIFNEPDIVLHIDASVEDTFTSMVLANVLVTSRSSLSYTAGILSEGKVYYIPFWHPPLPGWITIN